jgi:general secretion pathway protein N
VNITLPPRRWILFTLLCLIGAVAAYMPLRYALAVSNAPGVTAKSVQGVIWSGRFIDLKAGALTFGDVNARLRFFPLLTGRAEYEISQNPILGGNGFSGTVGNGWGGMQIEHLSGTANSRSNDSGLPLAGIEFQDFSVRFSGGKCRSASGSLRLLIQPDAIPGINIDSGFLGTAKCRSGKLFLPMVSGSAMERADISVDASGKYSVSLILNNVEPLAAPVLSLAGFRPIAGGYLQMFNGRF